MNPDRSVKALASTEVDVSSLEPGKSITVLWRGKPVFIKRRTEEEIAEKKSKGLPYSLRLNSKRAEEETGKLFWNDQLSGIHEVNFDSLGDVVLVRKDIGTSYHLAVTLDDDFQDVTCVTRGIDLYESTHIHRILQSLLELNVPEWSHHKLIKGSDGNKYSKSDKSLTLKELRESEVRAKEIRKEHGF